MRKKIKVMALAGLILLWGGMALAQLQGIDPCLTNTVTVSRHVAAVPISSATTTAIIPTSTSGATGGPQTYICSLNVVTGSASTWKLEYGTGSICATGTQALTGVYPASSTIYSATEGTQMVVPTGQNICILSTGTGGTNGYITYVVQ